MKSRIMTLAAAVLLCGATAAVAQTDMAGQVVRIEPEQQVIVLSNGQMYRVTPQTTIYVNNQPVTLNALKPGETIAIRSGEMVALQNGQYVVVGPTAVAPGTSVVVTQQSSTVVPAGIRQTVFGKVEDIDRDGTVKIGVDRETFKVKMTPEMARQLRDGDRVQLDITINPAGAPAASPR